MKVYQDFKGFHIMFVKPGMNCKKDEGCSEWFSAEGVALQFEAKFINGVAEVPDPLGKYMIDKKLARATRIDTLGFVRNEHSRGSVRCPECATVQPEPSEETHYICSNFNCRRDFIKNPIEGGLEGTGVAISPLTQLMGAQQ